MSTLPTGYKQLEYIESTGTQHIDTGFFPSGDTRVTVKCKFDVQSSGAWLFGARAGTYVNTFNFLTTSNLYRSDYGNGSAGKTFSVSDSVLDIDKDKGTLSVNGVVQEEKSLQSFTSSKSLYFFANNNNGSVQGKCLARVFEAAIYDRGLKVRDFVPCENISGENGLYDTVGKKFYGNSGTGDFIAGPEVITTPDAPGAVSQRTAVALVWGAVECEGYRVYKNGSAFATTTHPNYVDYAVGDGQTIEYSITAFNGEYESDSVSVSVTVKEGYTSLIPVITSAFFQ